MGNPLQLYLQMLAQQQQGGQDPAQQMSQQGQFNPANVQAQGGAGPQPFSFAPVQGGLGRNILNALANAGKAATYVAEDPRERERDDARAQQLWETKQKMSLAAGEFGQREKDRAQQAADTKARVTQAEADRQSQQQIEKDRIKNEPHTIETPNGPALWDAQSQSYKPIMIGGQPVGPKSQPKPDTPEQQFFDSPEEQGKTMAQKISDYAKASQKPEKPGAESGTWQMVEDANGKPTLFNSKTGQTKAAPAGVQKAGTYQKQFGGASESLQYANDYMQSKNFTGTGDEALMEKFFDLAKPSSGFRMTQPQMDMLNNARDAVQGLKARAAHYLKPSAPYFDDTQRQNIVNTMNSIVKAKQEVQGRGQGAGGTQQSADPFAPFGGQKR